MEFAAEIGVIRIILEGDSYGLTNTLNSGGKSLAQFGHLTNAVLFSASENFNAFKVSHICRQYNNVAHVLARRAIRSFDMLVWMKDVTPDIVLTLQADLHSLP
nr:hypothetical protein CFP56_78703 [Quercus suber]